MAIVLASKQDCTGCLACIDICPKSAINRIIGDDGHQYVKIDPSKCIECGLCEKACPIVSDFSYQTKTGQTKSQPFAAWNTNEEQRLNSASGGIFAALATYIISIGGYVSGAISDGKYVRHIIIDKQEDLPKLQGSKYLQSNTQGIYKQIRDLLKQGKYVLFSGTGCQVGGLLSFLRTPYPNLITVDLVCAGVPSQYIMDKFCLEEKVNPKTIRWRDKETGWKHGLQLTISTVEGSIIKQKTQNSFFWGGFLGGNTNRLSCHNCHFCGTDRQADFTIADYWGIKDYKEQHFNGVSVLITHSEKAKEIAKKCNIEMHETNWRDCVSHNPRIVDGKKSMTIERRILPFAIKHFNYSTMKKLYANIMGSKDFLWLPYKVFKFLRWKINGYSISKKTNKILNNL